MVLVPQCHRGSHLRDAVHKVGCAVHRVDDPAQAIGLAFALAAFFGHKGRTGHKVGQFFLQKGFHRKVGLGNKINAPLVPHVAGLGPMLAYDVAALAHNFQTSLKNIL